MQLNAQSIANKLDILLLILSSSRPVFLNVTEHWCSSESISSMTMMCPIFAVELSGADVDC